MKQALLTPRWIITTLLVIAAAAVMIRLGFWQLDRLEQRREFNRRVQAQIDAPVLDFNQMLPVDQLYDMEYRQVVARGVYDHSNTVILRNQVYQNQPGYHLLTPLKIEGSDFSVLVDRGFIPMDQNRPELWAEYSVAGVAEVHGVIRRPHVPRMFGVPDPTLAPGETRLDVWNSLNLERIQQQIPYRLLPVIITENADPLRTGFPISQEEQPDLSEGSHLGYALQWFSFAGILAVGYPFFVRSQTIKTNKGKNVYNSQGPAVRAAVRREDK